MVTKQQMRVLAKAMERAATLAGAHEMAVNSAARLFSQIFGEDVPEECFSISGGNSKNDAAMIFNAFVSSGENMVGSDNDPMLVVQKINELM